MTDMEDQGRKVCHMDFGSRLAFTVLFNNPVSCLD